MEILQEANLEYSRPEGAYYVLVDAPDGFEGGTEFTDFLLKKVGVAVLPAAVLYHNQQLGQKKVRIAFCKKDVTLQEVRHRLKKMNEKRRQKAPVKRRS